ncbi:uncharacterized protein LOC142550211 [Primulina tabacum]|uniref:uncharacterized protein LOC142550211 n=1 Tax=Primulina tabacum TaxID=48773 RepID=UPI003F5AD05D
MIKKICEEVGIVKFCLLTDEAKDISDKEQKAIVLRFVDREGFLMERFFDILHVSNTTTVTLKKEIYFVLGQHDFRIKDIRGQGYEGSSNMCGSWNRLQALFLRDSPQAYYASPKRHAELQSAQAIEIETMVANVTTVLNQIGTLQRAGKTRWSSHFESICRMIDMYSSVIIVLWHMMEEASSNSIRGEATDLSDLQREIRFWEQDQELVLPEKSSCSKTEEDTFSSQQKEPPPQSVAEEPVQDMPQSSADKHMYSEAELTFANIDEIIQTVAL